MFLAVLCFLKLITIKFSFRRVLSQQTDLLQAINRRASRVLLD